MVNESIKRQKQAGTLDRNRRINKLAESGISYAEIGREYNRCRERIRQIVKRAELENIPVWQRIMNWAGCRIGTHRAIKK